MYRDQAEHGRNHIGQIRLTQSPAPLGRARIPGTKGTTGRSTECCERARRRCRRSTPAACSASRMTPSTEPRSSAMTSAISATVIVQPRPDGSTGTSPPSSATSKERPVPVIGHPGASPFADVRQRVADRRARVKRARLPPRLPASRCNALVRRRPCRWGWRSRPSAPCSSAGSC
jgi:hypothetical protein